MLVCHGCAYKLHRLGCVVFLPSCDLAQHTREHKFVSLYIFEDIIMVVITVHIY